MYKCWQQNPGMRPSFSDLVHDLDRILALAVQEDYLDLMPPETVVSIKSTTGSDSQYSSMSVSSAGSIHSIPDLEESPV